MAQLLLGKLVMTCNVMALQHEDPRFAVHILQSLLRYSRFDWGDMDDEGIEMNNMAIGPDEDEVIAIYQHPHQPLWEIWIKTMADRSTTFILFPNEY